MGKLPILSGEELIRLLKRDGFIVVRSRGSHISFHKGVFRMVVPLHDELAKGPLLGILKQCGMGKEDLERLIEKA